LAVEIKFARDPNWDFQGEDTQYLTHNFHPFPGKFIPQIPKKLMEEMLPNGGRVLDPFCGSGTTLVEAKLLGNPSAGVDINPLFILISKVKTTPIADEELDSLEQWAKGLTELAASLYYDRLDGRESGTIVEFQERPELERWFTVTARKELAFLKNQISKLRSRKLKNFCEVCLSSILVRVSLQDSDTRYARIERKLKPLQTVQLFQKKLDDMINRMKEFSEKAAAVDVKLLCQDTRSLARSTQLGLESFDLVVTSPPYVNAYDYHKYHRQRMNWLDIDASRVRRLEIGGHDRYTRKNADSTTYFSDLAESFSGVRRLMRPGARCCVVIGDGIVGGREIPTHKTLVETLMKTKFDFEAGVVRKVDTQSKYFRQGARIQHEYILVLRKPNS
jgi:site-specific DNA-methyltransferase (cytosine-N4-specific)